MCLITSCCKMCHRNVEVQGHTELQKILSQKKKTKWMDRRKKEWKEGKEGRKDRRKGQREKERKREKE